MLSSLQNFGQAASQCNTVRQSGKNWLQHHYDIFYRLYITESLPLPEVISRLEKNHGFIVTMKQCKLKIAEQGLKKNLKSPEMEIVAQELEKKRKAEGGQNTVVRFAGLEIHSQRIERYLHRKKRAKGEGEKHSDIIPGSIMNFPLPQEKSSEPNKPKSPEEKVEGTISAIAEDDIETGSIYTIVEGTISAIAEDDIDTGSISTMTEELGRLLKRLCVSGDNKKGKRKETEAPPGSDGTINIQQMMLINKPQRHELDILRAEWEKQRENAWHLISRGELKDAEQRVRVFLGAQLALDGARGISTLGSINLLSYIHRSQTNTLEVKTYEWILQSCTEIYGQQDPATLDAKRDLAWVYQAEKEENNAQALLGEILRSILCKPKDSVPDMRKHFLEMSRATTDVAVLLCLQGKISECDKLLGALWSAVAFFTLKHKCSLRVASAMGRKLASMGDRDDVVFLLTSIVQSAVMDSSSSWDSYLDVSSHCVKAGIGHVGEILQAYGKHVLPQLGRTMAILRKIMGFGTANCEPVCGSEIVMGNWNIVSGEDFESFNRGEKLTKRYGDCW